MEEKIVYFDQNLFIESIAFASDKNQMLEALLGKSIGDYKLFVVGDKIGISWGEGTEQPEISKTKKIGKWLFG